MILGDPEIFNAVLTKAVLLCSTSFVVRYLVDDVRHPSLVEGERAPDSAEVSLGGRGGGGPDHFFHCMMRCLCPEDQMGAYNEASWGTF